MSASRSAWVGMGVKTGSSTASSEGWLRATVGALVGETTGPADGAVESLQPASVRIGNKAAKKNAWRRWRNFDRDVIVLELSQSSEIRPERFGDENVAVRLLAGFEQGDVEPRQGDAGAVESVAENIFPFAVLVTQIHPARLEILEIAARGNFQPGVDARGPDLNIIALRRAKANISRAEGNHAIVQAE